MSRRFWFTRLGGKVDTWMECFRITSTFSKGWSQSIMAGDITKMLSFSSQHSIAQIFWPGRPGILQPMLWYLWWAFQVFTSILGGIAGITIYHIAIYSPFRDEQKAIKKGEFPYPQITKMTSPEEKPSVSALGPRTRSCCMCWKDWTWTSSTLGGTVVPSGNLT